MLSDEEQVELEEHMKPLKTILIRVRVMSQKRLTTTENHLHKYASWPSRSLIPLPSCSQHGRLPSRNSNFPSRWYHIMWELNGIQLLIWPTSYLNIMIWSMLLLTSGSLGLSPIVLMAMNGSYWVSWGMCWRCMFTYLAPSDCNVSQILKDTTLFFSHKTPNLTLAIPAMDYMDESFTNSILLKHTIDPAIWAAIQLAKKTLNQYYTLTDTSSMYCIPMGMFSYTVTFKIESIFWDFGVFVI